MKVGNAQICLDCDEVYHQDETPCPGCGSCSAVALRTWLMPLPTREELERAVRGQALSRCADALLLKAREVLQFDGEEPLGCGA
jgi:hypothetical protein